MTLVELEDIVLLGFVSLIHVWQCGIISLDSFSYHCERLDFTSFFFSTRMQ